MQIGNQTFGREDMPSFLKANQIPYYMYQSMQDTLKANLPQAMQVQPQQNNGQQPSMNVENNTSMWNGDNQ